MGIKNTSSEFGSAAKWLHWLVAIGIVALFWLGLEQSGMERGPEKLALRGTHASIALAVLVLMTLRVIWRLMNEVPAHPDGMPGWQKLSSTLVHLGIYIAVFVQLISGAMVTATGGKPLPFFGLFSVPLPVAENHDNHEFWEGIHESAWIAVAVILGIHILGAFYNHFIVKNDVLRRMTIGVKS
jgi:cytochrome b561